MIKYGRVVRHPKEYAAFADTLANTGSVVEAAKAAGISETAGYMRFSQMRKDLGWQAA